MNTFYIYHMKLDHYERLMEDDFMDDRDRQLHLNQHLLISGTNRRVMTEILRLNGSHQLTKSAEQHHEPFANIHAFGIQYNQIQEMLQNEVRMAAGHFSNSVHRVNLSLFYYLSFYTTRELTVVLLKDELPAYEPSEPQAEEMSAEVNYSRFYHSDLPE